MKVRFSRDSVRVRIDRDAFDRMRRGGELRLVLPLTADGFAVVLRAGCRFGASADAGTLAITVPEPALAELAGRLPCRDGLEFAAALVGRWVAIVLEVDVRPARRLAASDGPTR